MSGKLFIVHFWLSTEVVYLQRCMVITWLVPLETAAISACSLYTILSCHITLRHAKATDMWGACVCIAVTCYQHFWQNDLDPLHATAVMRDLLPKCVPCLSSSLQSCQTASNVLSLLSCNSTRLPWWRRRGPRSGDHCQYRPTGI